MTIDCGGHNYSTLIKEKFFKIILIKNNKINICDIIYSVELWT